MPINIPFFGSKATVFFSTLTYGTFLTMRKETHLGEKKNSTQVTHLKSKTPDQGKYIHLLQGISKATHSEDSKKRGRQAAGPSTCYLCTFEGTRKQR